jgi:hypothetical protein
MASNLDPSILNNNNERFETGSSRTGYNNGKQSLQASNLKEINLKKKNNMIWMFVQLYLQIAIGGA